MRSRIGAGKLKKRIVAGAAVVAVIFVCIWSLQVHFSGADGDSVHIEQYVSGHDEDGDGIDDQMDLLTSSREYIATKPKYKSRYYSGGYPNDGYGVCTDVVAFAFRGAGYDLMRLVEEDVQSSPEAYGIETPDANIDFRRVDNLNVYFSRHAKSLTTDLHDISSWQGGDIVVFSGHVAMISDKRNKKGIPYIIHHVSVTQKNYEEDKLERWEKKAGIIGHYRLTPEF